MPAFKAAARGEQKNSLLGGKPTLFWLLRRLLRVIMGYSSAQAETKPLFFSRHCREARAGHRCCFTSPCENRCARHFALFPGWLIKEHADKNTRVAFAFSQSFLPCQRCPARWLPVFVPGEAALRWLPPTPSSYCSGLLEWGRIRHSLTIALLNANLSTRGHGRGKTNEIWQSEVRGKDDKCPSLKAYNWMRAGYCSWEGVGNVGVDRATRKIQMRRPGALPTGKEVLSDRLIDNSICWPL